jgi:hypothetical protein
MHPAHRFSIFVAICICAPTALAGIGRAQPTLTRSQYVARADAICREVVPLVKAVPPLSSTTRADLLSGQLASADYDDLGRYFTAVTGAAGHVEPRLRALPVPHGDALLLRWRSITFQAERLSRSVRDAATSHDPAAFMSALDTAAKAATPLRALSRQLGFKQCARFEVDP